MSSMTMTKEALLEALLDSWDRNNTILLNLLHALPQRGMMALPPARAPVGKP